MKTNSRLVISFGYILLTMREFVKRVLGGIMSVKDNFAQRFSLLRSVYKFTYKDLGNVLSLNANTLTEWAVSKRNFPNPDKLVLLANLYGVSLDWLLGRTNDIYNSNVLLAIEEKDTLSILKQVYQIIPNDYEDTELRQSMYSLGIRANIITLAYSSMYSAISLVLGNDFYKRDDFADRLVANHNAIVVMQTKLLTDQDNIIYKMLHKEITKPVFDVVAAFKNVRA